MWWSAWSRRQVAYVGGDVETQVFPAPPESGAAVEVSSAEP